MIPGISTLKTWGVAILAGATAILYALFQREKAKRIEDEHEDVQNAQRVERQSADIVTSAMTEEGKVRDKARKRSITEHFGR